MGGSGQEFAYSIDLSNDGGYIIAGSSQSNDGDVSGNHGGGDYWVVKIDSLGSLIWQKSLGGSGNEVANSIQQTTDGGYIVAGESGSNDGDVSGNHGVSSDFWILKLDLNGNIIWEKSFGGFSTDKAYSIQQTQDGGFIAAGQAFSNDGDVTVNNGTFDYWITKINSDGNLIWQKSLGGSLGDYAQSINQSIDGGYIIVGYSTSDDIDVTDSYGNEDYWIVKLKEINIRGSVFNDYSMDCNKDNLEPFIEGINLTINPGNYIDITDNDGLWSLDSLPVGTYTVTIDTTNLNWSPTCSISQNFTVTDPTIFTLGPDFGLFNTNPCTEPDVSIFAPSLRRCFSNRIVYVSACNQAEGIGTIDSSYLDVELDLLLTVDGASLPYTDLGNNIFRFETGDIYPGQCVNFTLSTTVSCNAQNGQTLCMDATLHPAESCVFDSIPSDPITSDGVGGTLNGFPQPCTLPWDQSSLSVDGWCQGDSVYFSITNTGDPVGGDMECYSPMWVTIDGVVTYTDSIMINGSETVVFSYFGNGQTWILNAEQHPLHPGNSHPNAHVELCGDSTNWTPGIINQFPLDDADPTVDIYCGQVTAPFDPNDKTGYPLGQTEEFYIQPNQQLQYVNRFQNVGTDTAFNVVVRDTLDIDLNIFTVTPGVASHPYTFKMYGPRVLEWTFENIQLPDSTANSEGSNGFLTFHVAQVPDLEPGTVINNDADIYFDFELPITTNTAVHKIFEGFVEILNVEDLIIEGKQLFIYPNPTSNFITIKSDQLMNSMFNLFDQQGRKVMNGKLRGKNTEVSIGKLPQGIYTIQVVGNYKPAIIIKQ